MSLSYQVSTGSRSPTVTRKYTQQISFYLSLLEKDWKDIEDNSAHCDLEGVHQCAKK